jgi:hypothetical protein
MDWGAWSRDSVTIMTTRTRELVERHQVPLGAAYRWDLDTGSMMLGDATFRVVTAGTVAGDSFLWSWANDTIPDLAKTGIERVRAFGVENDLALLVEPCAPGGLSQLKECTAVAARVLDAQGLWLSRTGPDGFIAFVLFEMS